MLLVAMDNPFHNVQVSDNCGRLLVLCLFQILLFHILLLLILLCFLDCLQTVYYTVVLDYIVVVLETAADYFIATQVDLSLIHLASYKHLRSFPS
jgi:hypothetical protein